MTLEEQKAYKHAYYLANKHKWKESYRRNYDKAPEKFAARCAKWRAKNRKKLCARQKRYAQANREQVLAKARAYQKQTIAARRAQKRVYREKNRERLRKYFREYVAQRCETDANFKLRGVLRSRIRIALRRRGLQKATKTEELVGCTTDFLRGYLDARFLPGMNIPCAEFDLRDETQQRQCFHYSNLRPLWGPDNISKGAKRPATHQAELV